MKSDKFHICIVQKPGVIPKTKKVFKKIRPSYVKHRFC